MFRTPRIYWLLLATAALSAFLAFAYPMYVIRPFRAQGARELAAALAIRSWGPVLALVCAMFSVVLAALLWRTSSSWITRGAAVAGALVTVSFAALSHINVYERMFHRIDTPEFEAAAQAKLEADDMILAVSVDGRSRAYPIRAMGYHHIVNDRLGRTPIVATY